MTVTEYTFNHTAFSVLTTGRVTSLWTVREPRPGRASSAQSCEPPGAVCSLPEDTAGLGEHWLVVSASCRASTACGGGCPEPAAPSPESAWRPIPSVSSGRCWLAALFLRLWPVSESREAPGDCGWRETFEPWRSDTETGGGPWRLRSRDWLETGKVCSALPATAPTQVCLTFSSHSSKAILYSSHLP